MAVMAVMDVSGADVAEDVVVLMILMDVTALMVVMDELIAPVTSMDKMHGSDGFYSV